MKKMHSPFLIEGSVPSLSIDTWRFLYKNIVWIGDHFVLGFTYPASKIKRVLVLYSFDQYIVMDQSIERVLQNGC